MVTIFDDVSKSNFARTSLNKGIFKIKAMTPPKKCGHVTKGW